nr:hypothetical protein [Tanacetum cinerariifolium]
MSRNQVTIKITTEYLENSSNEIAASNSNQEKEKPPQDFDIRQLIREECCIEVCEEQRQNMENTILELVKICQQKVLYCMHDNVDDPIESALSSKLLSINLNSQRLDKKKQKVKNVVEQSTNVELIVSVEDENVFYVEEEEFDLEEIQDVILREKLLSINHLIANIESLNDNPTPDRVLNSSVSFPISEESDNSLSDNFLPEFETFCDHTEETRSGNTITHTNNSLPEYDSFCFKIEPDQERFINVVKNDISNDSTNDPLLEEVDLFIASDNSIPPGIENFAYDSERDIRFLEELLIDDSILFPNNEESDFDNPSFPRPLSEPPDAEFDFEPDAGEEISVVMNVNDELECFDPRNEIDVSTNDDYFPFMFVIRIFLPYLIYSKVFPLLLFAESEDTIFNPGISV